MKTLKITLEITSALILGLVCWIIISGFMEIVQSILRGYGL